MSSAFIVFLPPNTPVPTMLPRSALLVLFALPLLLLATPAQAQEADTTAVDTTRTDTTVADTTVADTTAADTTTADKTMADTTMADTTMADTTMADTTTADTAQATAAGDSLAADSLAADSLAADTVQAADRTPAQAKEQARAAATSWLSLTDAGKFGESWDAAASTLQDRLSRAAWKKRGRRARSKLNDLTSRELTRIQYRDSTIQHPTEAPVVTLQYRSEFAADSVLEALITTWQEGEWKVAGYRIVPIPETSPESDSMAANADTTEADTTSQQ